uniref:CSON015028 protein n=1 Tax=Culicoides sonorensis TaxID=179676 RepID=A0A336LSX7_CULSO
MENITDENSISSDGVMSSPEKANSSVKKDTERTFKSLVEFIGKHETHFNSFEDAKQLFFASKKYAIQDLESRCLKYITSIANHSNVCQIYEFAKAISNSDLISTCTNIMAWEAKSVLESDDFLCSKIATVKFIFTMDDLIIDSEVELFKALEKWIQLHMQIVSTELAAIKEVIYEIRFMSMTPKEFAEVVAHSDLLTANEKLGFLSNIVSEKSSVPLPPGFTMKRNRLMYMQERFESEFRQLIETDVSTSIPTLCPDCEQFYSGYYIDHVLFLCKNTSDIDRHRMVQHVLGPGRDLQDGEILQDLFDSKPAYQKALCRYMKLNFSWIQMHGRTFDFTFL